MSSAPDNRPYFLRHLYPRGKEGAGAELARALTQADPGQAAKYAAKAFDGELAVLGATPEGQRNEQLNISGFNLFQLVAAGHLEQHAVWDALERTALAIGLTQAETTATLRSALAGGTAKPRPPIQVQAPQEPIAGTLVTSALGGMGDAVNAETGEVTPGGQPLPPLPPAAIAALEDRELADQADPPAEVGPSLRERFPAIDWKELWADETTEEWILEPLIPARRLVALFSPPKLGKSLLMLELAVGIALGKTTLGYKPDRARRVLYVDFENDPRGDVRSRLTAMGYTPYQLVDLVYLSFPRLAHLDTYVGGLELTAVAEEYGCEVVVIDTVGRAIGGEENSNDTWMAWYRHTGLRLKAAGIACVRLDHSGKDVERGMRGGSAKYGDVDMVWAMSKVTETSFKLECTDTRVPVAEKVLVLHREPLPRLHHRVDPGGRHAAWELQVAAAWDGLDEAEAPLSTGRDGAMSVLAETGVHASKHAVAEAVKRRKDRAMLTGQTELFAPNEQHEKDD